MLLILVQFLSPFLHAHVPTSSQDSSIYQVHFHDNFDHDGKATNDVIHLDNIESYVKASNFVLLKNTILKKINYINFAQNNFVPTAITLIQFPPPDISFFIHKPVPLGFRAVAPPLA